MMCCNISKYFLRHYLKQSNTNNTTYNMFTMLLATLWSYKNTIFLECIEKNNIVTTMPKVLQIGTLCFEMMQVTFQIQW
jgi:hypothetical protein